jgi:hypothetical protein
MPLTLHLGTPDDADRCGTICYEAFTAIAEYHQFSSDFPSPQVAIANFARRLSHPGYAVVVAELDGRIVGSNVLDERSTMAGVGPITVDPTNTGVWHMLCALPRCIPPDAARGCAVRRRGQRTA